MKTIYKISYKDGFYEDSFMVTAPTIKKALAAGDEHFKKDKIFGESEIEITGVSKVGEIRGTSKSTNKRSRKK